MLARKLSAECALHPTRKFAFCCVADVPLDLADSLDRLAADPPLSYAEPALKSDVLLHRRISQTCPWTWQTAWTALHPRARSSGTGMMMKDRTM